MNINAKIPTAVSIFFSGTFFQIGLFGIFSVLLPLTHDIFINFGEYIRGILLLNMIYALPIILRQKNIKKIISGASILHTLFMTIGISSCELFGITAAFFNIIAYSIAISSILIIVSVIEDRFHMRNKNISGVALAFPSLTILASIPILSFVFMPLLPCFSGAMLITLAYSHRIAFAIVLCCILFCCMLYALKPMHNMFFKCTGDSVANKFHLTTNEMICLLPSVIFLLFIGLFPGKTIGSLSYSISHLMVKTLPQHVVDGGIF